MFLCLGITNYLPEHSMCTADVFQHGDQLWNSQPNFGFQMMCNSAFKGPRGLLLGVTWHES